MSVQLDIHTEAARQRVSRKSRRGVPPWVALIAGGGLILSLLGQLVFDVELNGSSRVLFKLSLPMVICSYAIAFYLVWRGKLQASKSRLFFWPGMVGLAFLFTCGGLLNFVNAGFSSGKQVHLQGPIKKLNWTSGKGGKRYYLRFVDSVTGADCKLRITAKEYQRLSLGQVYARDMQEGVLGYPYHRVF